MTPSSEAQTDSGYISTLLVRAHSPSTTERIVSDKIIHKPLQLLPTSSKRSPISTDTGDARATRQRIRFEKTRTNARGRKKPKSLTARQKRALCVYDTPKEELKYDIYAGLHRIWCNYMRNILGIGHSNPTNDDRASCAAAYITTASAGPKITSADFHGARLAVVRSRCAGRVGLHGVVVRDTKFTFLLITRSNQIKTVPKEGTIFRLEVPIYEDSKEDLGKEVTTRTMDEVSHELQSKNLVFDLQGDALMNRPTDRTTRKFKMHVPKDL